MSQEDKLLWFPTGHSPELVHFPKGSQVYPSDLWKRNEERWEIVKQVAETDSTWLNEVDGCTYCPYCNGSVSQPARFLQHEPFVHDQDCIVVKARDLMKSRVTMNVEERRQVE